MGIVRQHSTHNVKSGPLPASQFISLFVLQSPANVCHVLKRFQKFHSLPNDVQPNYF
jgi:hypothetical protein